MKTHKTKRTVLNQAVISSLTGDRLSVKRKEKIFSHLFTQLLPALAVAGLFLPGPVMAASYNFNEASTPGTGSVVGNVMSDTSGTTVAEDDWIYGLYDYDGTASANITVSDSTLGEIVGAHSSQGDASGNTVTITGEVTVTSSIYGGDTGSGGKSANNNAVYINSSTVSVGRQLFAGRAQGSGTASGNTLSIIDSSVTIPEVPLSDVYYNVPIAGGITHNGDASGNTVIIKNSTITTTGDAAAVVIGGDSSGGYNASNNTVTIESPSSFLEIVGGGSHGDGDTDKNVVTITTGGGAILTQILGGRSDGTGSASYNEVTVTSSDTDGATVDDIYGGNSHGGDASYNKVTVSGNVTLGSSTSKGFIYAGRTTGKGNASNNSVDLTNSGKTNHVYGGVNDDTDGTGSVTSNSVTIGGDVTEVTNVYVGYALGSGTVSGNTLTISTGTVSTVYAGYSAGSGDVSENTVTITGGTVSSIYGGRSGSGTASNNTVEVTGGSVSSINGGYSGNGGEVSENTVTIGGDVQTVATVYGGRSSAGKITKNTVTINAGTDVSSIYGGYSSGTSDITENTVNINGGNITGNVYAGRNNGTSGDATSNVLNINGGTMSGNLYAGYSANGTAQNNILNLDGASEDKTSDLDVSQALMYGSTLAATGLNGNTLNIKNFSGRIGNISNFDTVNIDLNGLDLATAVYGSGSIIILTDTAVAGTDLTNATVNVLNSDSSITYTDMPVAFTSESSLDSEKYTIVANENGDMTKDNTTITEKIMVVQDPSIYTGTIEYSEYDLVVDEEDGTISYVVNPDNEGTYTPPEPDPGPGPGPTPDTDEGKTVTALAGAGAKLSMYYAQLEDLRKRLGEVRYGAQDGIWARFIYQQDSFSGTSSYSAKQRWYGLNVGLDHLVSKDESNMWLLGANFKYGHAKQKVRQNVGGKGNLNDYGLNLYATYANQYGCYADFVVTFDEYKQKLGVSSDGSSSSGDYNSWGWGASIELGKMFSFKQNDEGWGPWHNHWWIEPQAQLSYYWLKGKDFAMSSGKTLEQKNGQSLVGRLGLVVGKHWSYGGSNKVDKRYVQAYLKGGVKHEFLGKQDLKYDGTLYNDRLRGTTGYYGAGVDWNLTKQLKAYAQVERESGGKYKKDIEASIGLKWQF